MSSLLLWKESIFITFLLISSICGIAESATYTRTCGSAESDGNSSYVSKYSNTAVWGKGYKNVTLLEKSCFLIIPRDAKNKRIDIKCSPPSTYYLVFLRTIDGSIQFQADLEHLPHEGAHMACFKVVDPGAYVISVNLISTNFTHVLENRNTSTKQVLFKTVSESTIIVQDIKEKRRKWLSSLPPCTLEHLSSSNNKGRWIGLSWFPNSCIPNRITPKEVMRCLDGKNVLIAGDSQLWVFFAELLNFLGKKDRCSYLAEYRPIPRKMASLRAYKSNLKGPVPYIPGSENIAVHTTEYGSASMATYYGTISNGFGVGRVIYPPEQLAKKRQKGSRIRRRRNPPQELTLKVTYVSHSDSNSSLFRHWMTDYNRAGPLANALSPFDIVLATSGLRDMEFYDTAADYANNLENEFVPSLRLAVRNMSHITWFGSGFPQESLKRESQLPLSNNIRAHAFDQAAKKVLKTWGVPWINMHYVSSVRDDLCLDSTHYSWPVSLSIIELWLGSICPQTTHVTPRC